MSGKYFSRTGTSRREFLKGMGMLMSGIGILGVGAGCTRTDDDYKGPWKEIVYKGKKPWNYASEIAEKRCKDKGIFDPKYECDPWYWLDQIEKKNPGLDYGRMIPRQTKFKIPDIE